MNPIVIEVLKETAKVAIPMIVNEFFKDDKKKPSWHFQKRKNRRPNYKNKNSR